MSGEQRSESDEISYTDWSERNKQNGRKHFSQFKHDVNDKRKEICAVVEEQKLIKYNIPNL